MKLKTNQIYFVLMGCCFNADSVPINEETIEKLPKKEEKASDSSSGPEDDLTRIQREIAHKQKRRDDAEKLFIALMLADV